MEDGGGPPEDGLQDQFSNHPALRGDEIPGGERIGKRRGGPRQVRIRKANVSEPSKSCRNPQMSSKPGHFSGSGNESSGNLLTGWTVAGRKAARSWFRLSCGTWEPGAPMQREMPKEPELRGPEYRCGAQGRISS